jgi:hypothetical protein
LPGTDLPGRSFDSKRSVMPRIIAGRGAGRKQYRFMSEFLQQLGSGPINLLARSSVG